MFHVGQKVICVNTGDLQAKMMGMEIRSTLIKGNIYTVHRIVSPTGILVAEVPPPPGYVAFRSSLFRPATEHKTDISIFTRMLDKEKVPA